MSGAKTILVTGITGLVGSALAEALRASGHTVRGLSRSRGDYRWDVERQTIDLAAFEGVDAVVHLAGESIAQRWNAAAKKRILDSRVDSTRLLANTLIGLETKPAFICASGISYYGNVTAPSVDETAPLGSGFLADVTEQWERGADVLVDHGNRVCHLRIGVVLSPEGGALAKMLPAFKLGLGGRIGSGKQKMSWVSLEDLVAMFVRCVEDPSLSGPFNAVAPQAATNLKFTKVLGKVLGRPTIFPVPAKMISLMFGEMAHETILSDVDAVAQRFMDCGFVWQSPDLESALRGCLQ